MSKQPYPRNEGLDYVVTKFVRNTEEQGFKCATMEVHFVRMPAYNEKGWYVQGLTIDGFRNRMQKRHIVTFQKDGGTYAKAVPVSFWYRCELRMDYEERLEIERKFMADDEFVRFDHASVWDFYAAIGYDHKKNKLAVESVRL